MEDDPLFDDRVIEIKRRKPRLWLLVIAAIALGLFLFGSQLLAVYVDSLWFSSLGYAQVYWYKFRLGAILFAIFLVLTFFSMRLPFVLLDRILPQLTERPRIRLEAVKDIGEINVLPWIYRPGVWVLSAAVALSYAVKMSQAWSDFALYLNAAHAGESDPIFNRDASFYLFRLPVLDLISSWLVTMAIILFIVVTAASIYIWYVERAQGFGSSDTRRRATTAISAAGCLLAIALAISTYLGRFEFLYSRHELFVGVSYTDANARLTAMTAMLVALLVSGVVLAINAFALKRPRLIGWTAAAVAAVWLIGLVLVPQVIQSFSVKPNELVKESPYIQHNIAMTRRAFGLDRFEEKPFQPTPALSAGQIRANEQTIDNIRLWDPHVLQSTFRQNQEIGNYYEFLIPDVDRYRMNGRVRQVMLAAREINIDKLQGQSRNWINQHLVYTHGYGVTMSTVNELTPEGSPYLVLKDMPVKSALPEIKVTRPEIYFGEKTNAHAYVRTNQPEFNYPATGSIDSYSEYEGRAGIPVGGIIRKTALAFYLGDGTALLFSDYITPESRVLMRRNVLERVRHLAPFLLFEADPYLVINRDGKLFWIIDGFTYSNRYPYSTSYPVANLAVNFIRNSVKAVVDAYEGEVSFYGFEPDDPVFRSYQNIFPSLFRASEEMPADLREHIRYPDLLTEAQARVHALYHMQNPQTFYNREDLWSIATIESKERQGGDAVPMEPYYVVMQLPGVEQAPVEFVNILPFTPAGAGRNNMIGWMAARSDGELYGQTLVFSFPKNITVNGPAQIKARVNQDAQLSQQITLWNQQGSKVLRGNLQVIPIADSLLYIEPIFLAAENSQLPELRQVAIATQDRLATGRTFDEALNALLAELTAEKTATAVKTSAQPPQAEAPSQPAKPSPQAQPIQPAGDLDRLAQQAQQLFSDYKRLTAEGKHREAGEKLEQLGQTLSELARKRGV